LQDGDDDDELLRYPNNRYDNDWSSLDPALKAHAESLFYTQPTWDLESRANIETMAYETVVDLMGGDSTAIDAIAYNEETWDCYINHYDGYDWFEIEAMPDVAGALRNVFGWTQAAWEGTAPPPAIEDKDWIELTAEEKEAADMICLDEFMWDGVPLPLWIEPAATEEPTEEETSPTCIPYGGECIMQESVIMPRQEDQGADGCCWPYHCQMRIVNSNGLVQKAICSRREHESKNSITFGSLAFGGHGGRHGDGNGRRHQIRG